MGEATPGRLIVLVRRGQRPTCVILPGGGGGLQPYMRLAAVLGETHNVYAVRAAGLVPGEAPEDRVDLMADSATRALDGAGVTPNLVFGWSMGGVIGWEVCVRLAARRIQPDLALLDSSPLPRVATAKSNAWLLDKVTGMLGPRSDAATVDRVRRTLAAQMAALSEYRADRSYSGRVLMITCADPDPMRAPSLVEWRSLAPDLRERHVNADHYEVFDPEHLPGLVNALEPFLQPAYDQAVARAAELAS